MTQLDTLRDRGWTATVTDDETAVDLREPGLDPKRDATRVRLNSDGSLHLVPMRSAYHVKIGQALT